jgi:hypothetical protein
MRRTVESVSTALDDGSHLRPEGVSSTQAMTAKAVAHWSTTAFVAFTLISGGYCELTRQWGTLDTVTILGYPTYFLNIIGVWKVAGGIALLVPRFRLLTEWAYAGIVFTMTGAFISHGCD